MAEKTLAQMIRDRMDSEHDDCLNAEVQRQWDEAMDAIEHAASIGRHFVDLPEARGGCYESEARRVLKKKLEENGFRCFSYHGLSIHW